MTYIASFLSAIAGCDDKSVFRATSLFDVMAQLTGGRRRRRRFRCGCAAVVEGVLGGSVIELRDYDRLRFRGQPLGEIRIREHETLRLHIDTRNDRTTAQFTLATY